MQELVRGLLNHVTTHKTDPGSFADLLRKVKDPKTGTPLTAQQMLPEVAALFFAGIDTTGHTGAWTLCVHPPLPARFTTACSVEAFTPDCFPFLTTNAASYQGDSRGHQLQALETISSLPSLELICDGSICSHQGKP